jgi:hypothetical protein
MYERFYAIDFPLDRRNQRLHSPRTALFSTLGKSQLISQMRSITICNGNLLLKDLNWREIIIMQAKGLTLCLHFTRYLLVRITFSALSLAALPKVSYAF